MSNPTFRQSVIPADLPKETYRCFKPTPYPEPNRSLSLTTGHIIPELSAFSLNTTPLATTSQTQGIACIRSKAERLYSSSQESR